MKGAWLVVVTAAACGSSGAPVATPPHVTPPVATVDAGPRGASPMVATTPTRAMIVAPHGAPIVALAITSDGTAAITADETGGMRLWPKLDGTREPCVVELPTPRSLAIAHHRDAFFVAWIDSANNLALAELDDRGRTLRHGAVPQDADFVGLAITDLGLLAWRSDQTIVMYDLDGVQVGRIGTEPGERLVNVAVNGTSALAVVSLRAGSAETHVVRPLQLAPLAWGKPFDPGGGDPIGPIAISKSGKRIALIATEDHKTNELRFVERSTGRLLASSRVETPMEIGFADEDHLACAFLNNPAWITTATNEFTPALNGTPAGPEQFATGDDVAVTARGFELQIANPKSAAFLGYGLVSPQIATLGPNQGLVVGMAGDFVELDAALAATGVKPPATPKDSTLLELHWMGGADFAANVMDGNGEFSTLILSDGHEPLPLKPSATSRRTLQPLRYEPSTRLLTVSFGDASVERWTADQHKLEYLASFPHAAASRERELVPLAPALAGGKELVDVNLVNGASVAWTDATTKQRSAAMRIAAFITADPAGHVYAWTVDPATSQLVISVLAPGKILATLPHDGTVTLWPDPKGTRVAEVGANHVALYKLDGTLVWKQALVGANQVLWPADDTLAIITAAGIARLDAATGAVTLARCGWSFGLLPLAHTSGVRIEPLCTQLGP